MAAPVKSKHVQQTKQQKVKGQKKNILIPPFQSKWPDVPSDVEEKILSSLITRLKDFPRLEPLRNRSKVNKDTEKDTDSTLKDGAVVENEEDLVRRRLRCQLAIGHSQVVRGLERGELCLVLAWRGAQPALLVDCLLPLAASRRCPALALRKLMPQITSATGLSSLVALGFKKSQPGLSDFSDFVTMASKLAPPFPEPWTESGETDSHQCTKTTGDEEESDANNQSQNMKTPKSWPSISKKEESQLLEKLNKLLIPYKDVFKKPKPRFTTKEWKNQRKIIRNQLLTDLAALGAAGREGRLELVLVQKEDVAAPRGLAPSTLATPTNGCLILEGLRATLAPLLRNPLIRALGFKKTQHQSEEFNNFKQFAAGLLSPEMKAEIAKANPEVPTQKTIEAESTQDQPQPTKNKASRGKQTPAPIYNVSHLYQYKADTSASSKSTKTPLSKLSESFISLNHEPTRQVLWPSNVAEEAASQTICKGGDSDSVERQSSQQGDMLQEESNRREFDGVMGMEEGEKKSSSNVLFSIDRGTGIGPTGTKRKNSSDDFVSFSLMPTKIIAVGANPNKKKKKKTKKN